MRDPIDQRLTELGYVLPAPMKIPAGMNLPFPWVKVYGTRAFVSGHGPLKPDGSITDIIGKVGKDVTLQQAQDAARLTALAMLSSLKRSLGSLDRIDSWLRVFGMINTAPGFDAMPLVINGFSEVMIAVFGEERGNHARSAVGLAELPLGIPVEIEAEVALRS